MKKNKEIHEGKECIVEYDLIEHPVTHNMVEMPVSTNVIETDEVSDITYNIEYVDGVGKLKKTKTKREKVTLEKIYSKLLDIESNLKVKTT